MANDRYIRHQQLKDFGSEGQAKLTQASVLVVGLGGLGLPVVQYLNAMGVGTLGLVEQDLVEKHNLQRQVLYSENDVGKPKLEVALDKLAGQNTTTDLVPFDTFLTKHNALQIIEGFDVVVDATDNFATRYLINDVCVMLHKPFVYGALHGFEGQVSVFNHKEGPTYRCLFPKMPRADEVPNCDENGVLGVLPGIIGTLQALETVKVITGIGEVLAGKLLVYEGLTQTVQKIRFAVNPENKKINELQASYGIAYCESTLSLSAKEFAERLKTKKLQVIDVRNPDEYNDYHLDGAKNIPLHELPTRIHEINFGATVYLICQSGKRSAAALEIVRKEKPKASILHILGGMDKTAPLCL
ncbi:HesA/MoeB/ThiF family protein [Allomuricauda sp. SCSIO 65647]|uniref:HesA/MoeB/ThiF family protein n=1 Tax=Allomuricauda sp. SCSIO 65647 TaxID=2908843 RepID=UPI001F242390|nr:HesA/MoeB/ThiF family protein [Muricauda sp. SCSIO 65647]UJH67310.1 HesA/MoeB/ThiF family protein [Muricauda sp. SCSIO 65647]